MWIQLNVWFVVLIGLKLTTIAVSILDNEILASEGSTVTLKCPYGLAWEFSIFSEKLHLSKIADGNSIDPTFRNSVRYHIDSDVETGNYELQISNVTSDDNGVYRCSYVKENKTGLNDIHLRLKKAPKNIRFVTNDNLSVIEGTKGQNITLSCVVDSGIPREMQRINRNDSEVARGDHGSLKYTLLLQKSDHMSVFTCTAMSPMLTGQLITSIRIHVNYRPDVVIQNGSMMNIHENKQLTLTCSYDCLPPMEKIVWFKINDKGNFTLDENKHSLVLSVINRNQTGIYVCQVLNVVGEGQANISVTIQYPPVVNVTIGNKTVGKRILICHAYGVPGLYMYSKWEHMSSFREHIRFLDGFDNGTLILPYLNESDSYQDNGIYMCTVNNGIPDDKGSINQTGVTSINAKDRPRFSIENKDVQYGKYGESTKLEFYVYSFSVKEFVLTNLEGRHYNICGLNITVDKIMAKFYQKFIHVNGYKITFDTKILTDLDFRKYNVIVRNSYGEDVFNFTLQSASLPQLPYNITVTSSPNTITVYWSSGFNGGFEQSFYIEICQDNGGDWREYGPFIDSPVKYQSGQIRDLQPGNVYLIRMYANNSVGYSNMTDEVKERTRDLHTSYSKHITVGIVAVAVLIICASVTVSIYRKWLKKRKDRAGNMNIVDVNEGNQGVIPIENVLYQSQNLPQITDRRAGVTDCTTGGRSNTMDVPVVASYSAAESENDQEVFNEYLEDIDRHEHVSRDLQRQRRTPIKNNDLNYSELVFSPSACSRFIIHGMENKTIYSEVDLSIRVSPLQSSDEENNIDSDDDDDDFMSVEDMQKYIKREERNC